MDLAHKMLNTLKALCDVYVCVCANMCLICCSLKSVSLPCSVLCTEWKKEAHLHFFFVTVFVFSSHSCNCFFPFTLQDDHGQSQLTTPVPLSDDSSLERSVEEKRGVSCPTSPTPAPVCHHLEVGRPGEGAHGMVRSMEGVEAGRPTSPTFLASHRRVRKTITSEACS